MFNKALLKASKKGILETVQDLVEQGAEINFQNLVEQEVDVNCQDHRGNTPLMHSSLMGRMDVTEFLVENGISLIYTRIDCDNPDLTEVRESVYILTRTGDAP